MTPPPKPRKSKIMFGPELTPEEFDKKLPVVKPISKGRTPPRRSSTGYSILKGAERTKTAGVLGEEEGSPEDLGEPGTPTKTPGEIPRFNLDKSIREEEEAASEPNVEPIKESIEEDIPPPADEETTTVPQPAEEHVPQPTEEVIPAESTASPVIAAPRVSDISSAASSEDNIVIYDTTTSDADQQLNCTIDDFLVGDKSLNQTRKSDVIPLETSSNLETSTTTSDGGNTTQSTDNIIIYHTDEEGEGETPDLDATRLEDADETRCEASILTEPPVNTTIEDFMAEGGGASAANTPDQAARRKSVRFGPSLTPEMYDKALPANTPVRKGGLPGRYSVPNPQLSAGRTPMRKTIATCPEPVGKLKLDDSFESMGSFASMGSLDSANQEGEEKARTTRRRSMTPKEVKANVIWAGVKEVHTDSPIITTTPKIPRAKIDGVLVS
eukprot:sb/3464764/